MFVGEVRERIEFLYFFGQIEERSSQDTVMYHTHQLTTLRFSDVATVGANAEGPMGAEIEVKEEAPP